MPSTVANAVGTGSRRRRRLGGAEAWIGPAVLAAVAAFIALQAWWWVVCRVEVEAGKVMILIAQTGTNLPSGEIIASQTGYKGIQLDVLGEGRYFYNPLFWDWKVVDMQEIPAGKIGVLTRLYGREFSEADRAAGKIIAEEGEKGILRDVLVPNRYRINPYAYRLEQFAQVEVPTGFVGVVTNLDGAEPQKPNTFLVEPNEKGVSRKVLTAGTHMLNPYVHKVDLMDCRSQRFELAGQDALKFPSSDAFEMTVLMTVEWSIDQDRAAEIFVRVGEMQADPEKNEILQKLLIPSIRGYGRIEGSKYSAIDYIAGASRQVFQNTLREKLEATCEPKGIVIKSVLINDIVPPEELAKPIREREIAKEELNRNQNQLKQAQAEQQLAATEEMVKQQQEAVTARTANLVKVISAKNRKQVALIEQEKLLTMERSFLEASRREAAALIARGKAAAEVIRLQQRAEAEALRQTVQAYRSPEHYAYCQFLERVAPSFDSILANTDSPFGRIFADLVPPAGKGGN